MIKKSLLFLLYILPILLIQSSCKKNGLTVTNTFICKVNGKVFTPYASGGVDFFSDHYPVLTVSNSRNSNSFRIYARNQATDQTIFIEYSYISTIGAYKLRQYPYRGIYDGGYADPGWFPTDSVDTGQLILTRCDTTNKIYSGTFSFTAKEFRSGRIVQITDGLFDVKE